jgi:hypothetical protein
VAAHHGSLAKEQRLDAEQRLAGAADITRQPSRGATQALDRSVVRSPRPYVAQEPRLGQLYRLTLHFQNLKRTARRFVVEHGDHQPPRIPSEGVKVRSVLF